jgi:uncharacterized protein (TIGR00255 family)
MALTSMTGFARTAGTAGPVAFVWEVRSVNARGLEQRYRLPAGFETLEHECRPLVQAALQRGTFHAVLEVRDERPTGAVTLNRPLLVALWHEAASAARDAGAPPPSIDALLGVRGVIDTGAAGESEAGRETARTAIRQGFAEALAELQASRAGEGATLAMVLRERVDQIDSLARDAAAAPGRRPEAMRARLQRQLAELLGSETALDPQRLHQEAALLAVKADVQEELDRLLAHVEQARALLDAGGAVGRKLDFLAQEFGREANTLAAKAGDADLGRIGLALKIATEQFREQVQNVQ